MSVAREKADDWKQIQIIVKDHFIPSIVNFDSEQISDKSRKSSGQVLANPDYTYEKSTSHRKPVVPWSNGLQLSSIC